MLATQVMLRMQNAFKAEIPLRGIFEMPTIAVLAVRIAQSLSDDADSEEMVRLLTEMEVSASDTESESGEIGDKRYE